MKYFKKTDIFNKVVIDIPKRNSFELSHERLFSMRDGECTPILAEEVYPGEVWPVDGKTLIRSAPLARPAMTTNVVKKLNAYIEYRILWPNWNRYIMGSEKFTPDSPEPVHPYVVIPDGGFPVGSIADYLGFPTLQGAGTKVSAMKFMAYYRFLQEFIFNEAFQHTTIVMLSDGNNTSLLSGVGGIIPVNLLTSRPLHVNWEKDYFTSCLPEPQKGPDITIPLGTFADIEFYNNSIAQGVATVGEPLDPFPDAPNGGVDTAGGNLQTDGDTLINIDVSETHRVNLSTALASTINDLRVSFGLQKLAERLARGGNRPAEFLRTVYGANPSNLELDRPDCFGESRGVISVSEVLQQSQTTDDSPMGSYAGHGISLTGGSNDSYVTKNFGLILGFMWIKPETLYYQGVRRSDIQINNRFEKFYSDLAHVGEQPVFNEELYLDAESAGRTFGFLPYGSYLRYIPSSIHGEFRSTQKNWTQVREFSTTPGLNSTFVTSDPSRRIFADTSEGTDTYYVQHFARIIAQRGIPVFGTPGGI